MVTRDVADQEATEKRKAVQAIAQALLFAAPGAQLFMTVGASDWEALKMWAGPAARVRLIGGMFHMVEAIEIEVGGVTLKAQGPTFEPSLDDFKRMHDQRAREEG